MDIKDIVRAKLFSSGGTSEESGGSGITPSGTLNITENGTFDVTKYAKADVNVEASGGDSGGGATIYFGNFTPAENLTSIDIALEIEPKNFVFWKGTKTAGYGVRTVHGLWVIENADVVHIGSNSSGSSAASGVAVESYESYLNSVTSPTFASCFTYANGILTIKTGASVGGGGYLVPEQYNWMAW